MSTAKSMAAQYKQRSAASKLGSTLGSSANQRAFKSSSSNLAGVSLVPTANEHSTSIRQKSTSMTNLIAENKSGTGGRQSVARMQRPASRNALDSIHMGMNAKYASVQSKVLLQNIRPQQQQATSNSNTLNRDSSNKSPTNKQQQVVRKSTTSSKAAQQTDRVQLTSKVKDLEQQLDESEREREQLKREIERERQARQEQERQLRAELQDKIQTHERQQEEYHQKLLEAYELADQNRRAADTVLQESRQRDEEARKKIEELEQQLGELKEFVAIKEEMASKMSELRDQIRDERERYEEKTRSLNQMFESEKISRHPVDENSNYFRRAKQPLESMESVNNCATDASQMKHRSEHDLMYGSKLSTRMQDGARSAWKKSRKFASSVITGGRGFSACRRNSEQRASVSSTCAKYPQPTSSCTQVIQQQPVASVNSDKQVADEQHTSVVEVGQQGCADEQQHCSSIATRDESEQPIKVDQNNKLTIVTRFNQLPESVADVEPQQVGDNSELADSSHASRTAGLPSSNCCSSSATSVDCCVSASSSGRGTSGAGSESSAESSSQQDEARDQSPISSTEQHVLVVTDEKQLPDSEAAPKHRHQPTSPAISSNSSSGCASSSSQEQCKRHRRRSSLFKASKVFSGSQASLNKLRSFFAHASTVSSKTGVVVASGHGQPVRQIKSFDATMVDSVPTVGAESSKTLEQLRFDTLPSASLNGRALEDMLKQQQFGQGFVATN